MVLGRVRRHGVAAGRGPQSCRARARHAERPRLAAGRHAAGRLDAAEGDPVGRRRTAAETYADLERVCPQLANDMVVDRVGRAYVGNYGYDVDAGRTVAPTHLVRVDPDRSVHVEAPEVIFPNGCISSTTDER